MTKHEIRKIERILQSLRPHYKGIDQLQFDRYVEMFIDIVKMIENGANPESEVKK